ncbi:MAG: hypothetical protein AAGF94_07755 [Pseudomonadota bacterium]
MQILEGALAFAVAMILFSTVVSGVSETVLRVLNQRRGNIKRMIGKYLDQEFSVRFRNLVVESYPESFGISGSEGKSDSDRDNLKGDDKAWKKFCVNLVAILTENPLLPEARPISKNDNDNDNDNDKGKDENQPQKNWQKLFAWFDKYFGQAAPAEGTTSSALPDETETDEVPTWFKVRGVETLSTYAFLQRLAKTEVGKAFLSQQNTDEEKREWLTDTVRTFERYKAAGNEAYRKRGQMVSVLIALVIAVSFNISAARLFNHLVDSPEAREDLLARAEQIVKESDDQYNSLQDLLNDIKDIQDNQSDQQSGTLDTEEQNEEDVGDSETSSSEIDYEKLNKVFSDFQAAVGPLTSEKVLPIGAAYFPYACFNEFEGPSECDVFKEGGWVPHLFLWFLNVLLAGILIGLGGPFWYKVFNYLSHLVSFAGVLKGRNSEEMDRDNNDQPATGAAFGEPTSKGSEDGEIKVDILSVFKTAAGVISTETPQGAGEENN